MSSSTSLCPSNTELTVVGELSDVMQTLLHNLKLPYRLAGRLTRVQDVQRDLADNMTNTIIVAADDHYSETLGLLSWLGANTFAAGVIVIANQADTWFKRASLEMGALDYIDLAQSADQQPLVSRLRQVLKQNAESLDSLRAPFKQEVDGMQVIGSSATMSRVFSMIARASRSDASVFITGENGTGKDVCASLIHAQSTRKDHRLMSVNCAAIPQGLAESELFGHVKGSFTGAISERLGVAKMAHQGTLFLDEIAEMDLSIQGKLLRFLQSGTFSQVGSSQTELVDTRVICATNRNPEQAIEQGRFREDLFYRLNVIHIHLPPLRDRGEDVLEFAHRFMCDFSHREGKSFHSIAPEAASLLKNYRWPGNVRELQNVIQSIVVLNEGEVLTPSMLPVGLIKPPKDVRPKSGKQSELVYSLPALRAGASLLLDRTASSPAANLHSNDILPLDNVIQQAISDAINQCDGNVVEASLALGVSASTLYRRLKA